MNTPSELKLAALQARAAAQQWALFVRPEELAVLEAAGATAVVVGRYLNEVEGLTTLPHTRTVVYAIGKYQFFTIN